MIWLQAACLQATVLALAATGDGDPVLLDFTAVWCKPCQQMAPTIDRMAAAGARVQKIDVDRNRALADRYGVTKIPCFIVLSGNREIDREVGITSYDRLMGMYQRADQAGKAAAQNKRTVGAQPPIMPMRSAPGMASSNLSGSRTPAKSPANSAAVSDNQLIASSVRIRVQDPQGQSCGTGTIIDSREGWALVLTCGHIFRDSQGKGRIEVDLFGPNAPGPTEAELVSYDIKRDIGLLRLKTSAPVNVARVAPPSRQIAVGEPVINVGCNNGNSPTARRTRISSKNKYLGPSNLQAGGLPVEGRSGGGLFSADGQVIGVCNCADPKDNEGLYAAGEVIRAELDRAGLSFVFQDQAGGSNASPSDQLLAAATPPAMPKEMPPPGDPLRPPSRLLQQTAAHDPLPIQAVTAQTTLSPAESATLEELMRRKAVGAAIVCVVNSRGNPAVKSRSITLDRTSPVLLNQMASELRGSTVEVVSIISSPTNPVAKSEIIVLDQASSAFFTRLLAGISATQGVSIARR